MELTLDAACFDNVKQIHNYIANALQFPDWYGRNLDALYDCLTDYHTELLIRLKNWPSAGMVYRLGWTIQEAAEENPYLSVVLE